jgi:hypothetical protein
MTPRVSHRHCAMPSAYLDQRLAHAANTKRSLTGHYRAIVGCVRVWSIAITRYRAWGLGEKGRENAA